MKALKFSILSFCSIALSCAPAMAVDPQRGRCMAGYCLWTEVLNKELIKDKDGAKLYAISYREGAAPHMSDNDQQCHKDDKFSESSYLKSATIWYPPQKAYVFCSTKLPAFIKATAQVLSLDTNAEYYGKANAVSIYIPVCHNVSMNEFFSPKLALNKNYHSNDFSTIMVGKAEDLFRLQNPSAMASHRNKM